MRNNSIQYYYIILNASSRFKHPNRYFFQTNNRRCDICRQPVPIYGNTNTIIISFSAMFSCSFCSGIFLLIGMVSNNIENEFDNIV